ncbi:unnamed protein product [Malus baccata var. baccata]
MLTTLAASGTGSDLRLAASRAFFFSKALPNSTATSFSPIRTLSPSALSRFSTFDAYGVGNDGAPGIVVLQEWWGVDFEIKNHAVKISQLAPGFKALIPDLYRGKVGLDVAEVGVARFCMGGALSIASSVLLPDGDAVVAFYGVPPSEIADPAKAKAPVQAHFGELDSFVGFSDVTPAKSLEEKLKASGIPYEVHIYPGNAHAFMNRSQEGAKRRKDMGLTAEDEASCQLAWPRFQSWMSRYLST